MDDWRKRYYRAILDYLGGSDRVDLKTVKVATEWQDAGGYSEYTQWDAEINMVVEWIEPAIEPGGFVTEGRPEVHRRRALYNREVADLIRSFS